MDIRQLEIFLAVLDANSLTKGAKLVGLSPGAVSIQMQNLASSLRTELFTRAGRRLAPTAAAHRLAEGARDAIHRFRLLQEEFGNDPAIDTRPFHFATGATTLIHRLGNPLRTLRKRFPQSNVKITVASTEEMVAGLLDRRYDLALLSLPLPINVNLEFMPLYDEELLILQPSTSLVRGGRTARIGPESLQGKPFILYPPRSNMRVLIDDWFHKIQITPRVVMEAEDTEAIKRLVESGFGCSVLPEWSLRGQPHFFRTYRIDGHRLTRRQALATAKTGFPRALTDCIAEFLHEQLTRTELR